MRELKELIDIQKKEHISTILRLALRNKFPIHIWQRDSKVRERADGVVINLDIDKSVLELEATKESCFDEFELGEIFFFAEFRKAIFKAQVLKIGSRKIRISLPQMIKVEEARCEPRVKYGLRSYQSLDITTKSQKSANFITDLQMVDSSKDGVGFLARPLKVNGLNIGDKIFTERATVENIEGRIGVIRSITKQSNSLSGEKLLRIGVELF
ncbi:hypothetical protein [Bacteriovorax sp. DB6_IX]|uniref:hypothetical protein n=1 Tax=Bacteriovorax sp. DB6_IX TaxID=1353530 RepID=UPI00038A162E|nr:hypothetical protein [Bacteriovorax sp. DB6_IX]EQC50674.1 hypothetical protein M901_2005 [Bacteriovorax sp. DB6_IX]